MKSAPSWQKRARLAVVTAIAILTAAFLAAAAPEAPPKQTSQTPNLVLITLDTTRADHLGAWGWPHAQTPNLDALAARGTRFARCDTAAPITLPSHATILSGLFPPRHGVRDNGTFTLAPKVETVAELLAARGYDTGAVVSAVVLERRHGLDQGFRVYDDDLGEGYAAGTLVAERSAEGATAAALMVMKSLRPPFFLWVHYFDPHEEYRPPTRFADRARGPHRLYDGEISSMDEQIGELLGKLPPGTNVVAVGDHGEMLGEHGELTHGLLLYRGVRRVPLILAGPGVPARRVSDSLVRTADVAPTLLTLAGAPVPAGLDGQSLLPVPAGAGSSRQTYTESFLPFFAYKWYPLRSLGGDRYFYLKAPKSSVYDLKADAAEARDLAPRQPALVRTWEKNLAGFLKQQGDSLDLPVRPNSVLSEEQRQKLASLGYVAGATRGPVRLDLPDPRAMTEVAQTLHKATRSVQEGKCAEALRELDAIVKRDPHNFPALSSAGFCLRQLGRTQDALALFQRAAKENDLNPIPITDAAGCLRDLGRRQEAEREYRRALALDPGQPVAAANLARMLRERGETKEALAILDTAVRSGTHEPEVYLERAVARASISGVGGVSTMAEALADFREAARRNPNDAVALEGAARAAFQLGRYRESVQVYEQLLRSQANRLDLWKTAGAIYLYELDERPAALRCFRRALTLEVSPAEKAKLEELIRDLEG